MNTNESNETEREQVQVNPELISVRDLSEQDIPHILNYWFRSPPGFIESLGVDMKKMPLEADMDGALRKKIQGNEMLSVTKSNALAIVYENKAVGFHTIAPVTEGDFGIFHAHIWDHEMRGKGLGVHSYVKACQIFMQRFNLQKILFKTPTQNNGAIRIKEKLGIRYIGDEEVGFGIIKAGTLAKVYELKKSEIEKLIANQKKQKS